MNVLHVCASPKPLEESASRQLAVAFFTKLAEKNPDVNVTNVDLYQHQPPFLTYAGFRGMWKPVANAAYEPTDEEKKALNYSRSQVQLLKEADILVLTMPMWNGGMPAIMKAWLDQVLVPNQTYTVTADAAGQSLHAIRRVILLISSDEVFKEGDANDALTAQVNAAMNYIGVADIAVAWADGQDPVRFSDSAERKGMAVEAAQELAEEVAQTV